MNFTLEYPGITKWTGSASGAFVRGTSPGVFQMEIGYANAKLVGVGDLTAKRDGTVVWKMKDCAFTDMSYNSGGEGATATITFADRRWRWVKGGGWVSGSYNLKMGDAGIDATTRKTLRELFEIVLDELDETGYDLTDVPDIEDPAEVRWDHTRSVDALSGLLSTYGLDVVLRLDATNSVRIVKIGDTGGSLPSDVSIVVSEQGKFESLAVPESIAVIGAPKRWEMTFKLVPYGLDTSEAWRLVDDLSYVPVGGWGNTDPEFMLGLPTALTPKSERKRRKYAKDTVYRTYRVAETADVAFVEEENEAAADPDESPHKEFPKIAESWKYVLGSTLFASVANLDGTVTFQPAEVKGVFFNSEYGLENTEPDTLFDGQFSIDAKNFLVRFSQPMYKFAEDGQSWEFADLYLKTTVSLLDDNRAVERYTKQRDFHYNNRSGVHGRMKPDIEYQVQVPMTYNSTAERYERGTTIDNESSVEKQADYYLDAIEEEMIPREGGIRPLAGLYAVELDSEIQQMSFNISAGIATTTVSKNTEHRTILPYAKTRNMNAVFDANKAAGIVTGINNGVAVKPEVPRE